MRKQIDISGYLRSRFDTDYRNENWRFDCPFCGADRQRFSVSTIKGITHCWKCEYTNSILGFVADLESVSFGQAFRIVSKYVSVSVPVVPRTKPSTSRLNEGVPGFSRLEDSDLNTPMAVLARNYLKNRGVGTGDIQYWSIGISTDPVYRGRIIVPFIESGKVVYFVARKFIGPGPKYINPPNEGWGIGKSELLFNMESASRFDEIAIVEGVFDSFAVGKNSIGLMGKKASEVQLSRILMLNPKRINVCLDPDAEAEANELAARLGEIIPTYITTYKKGDPAQNRIAPHGSNRVRYSFPTYVKKKIGRFRSKS